MVFLHQPGDPGFFGRTGSSSADDGQLVAQLVKPER